MQIKEKMTPIRTVLSNKAFLRLWLEQVTSQLSINMLVFSLALVMYQNTSSNAAVSGLFLAYGFPALFFGMMAGAVVDRLDRRIVLIVSNLLRALMVMILFLGSRHIGVVYLIVFINAVITQFTAPAEGPTIPQLVPKSQLISANSLFSFTFYSSTALGFITAGPLLRLFGPDGSLLFISFLFLLAAFFVSGIPPQGEGIGSLQRIFRYNIFYIIQRVLTDLAQGVRYVVNSPVLLDALLLLTGTQITMMILGTLGPGFADKILQIDVRDASMLVVGPAIIGVLFGALWMGNYGYKYKTNTLITIGILTAGTDLMLLSALVSTTNVFWFQSIPRSIVLIVSFLLFFILGAANSLLDVPANSTLQKEADGELRGRVYGILSAVVGGIGILPVVVGGILADVIGVGKVIFALGLIIGLFGIHRLRFVPQNRVQ
jgi:MFS family permease